MYGGNTGKYRALDALSTLAFGYPKRAQFFAGELAQLMVVEFENPQVLVPQGNGLYKTETPGTPSENTRVLQGMIEGSNVNAVLEMTRMIDVSRAYQSTQRMMQSEHDRQRSMIQTLSRTN